MKKCISTGGTDGAVGIISAWVFILRSRLQRKNPLRKHSTEVNREAAVMVKTLIDRPIMNLTREVHEPNPGDRSEISIFGSIA
ncbi:hypothetical protein Y032_0105g3702 [Ancylostoma ceylanicum]|uniref:Uncharacterized protein n=1 Tax=Ancylostoma ceylanicum TaxID=53326 RepID=A0A016TGC8_9BILA|nr:hypothetical protein Y032_0105g3702 [Ancylostoma ceylanicum]